MNTELETWDRTRCCLYAISQANKHKQNMVRWSGPQIRRAPLNFKLVLTLWPTFRVIICCALFFYFISLVLDACTSNVLSIHVLPTNFTLGATVVFFGYCADYWPLRKLFPIGDMRFFLDTQKRHMSTLRPPMLRRTMLHLRQFCTAHDNQ